MITDLVQIRRLGEQKREENSKFRRFLKTRDYSERRLLRVALEIEESIDCQTCANCCRTSTTRVTDRDAERLAHSMRISKKEFLARYTAESEEEGRILNRTEDGCVFLDGNLCAIYEDRPAVCAAYPHFQRSDWSLVARMWQFVDRASVCPIVYNALEAFKDHTGFRR